MIYGSVASGIESASVAWEPSGWKPAWFSEIDKFPKAVLAKRFPDVPDLGDMLKIHTRSEFNDRAIRLLVAGTPCQSYSVAGLRGGMADPRGNLTLSLLGILDRKRPQWLVWENVPGILSSWTDEAEGATADPAGGGGREVWQSNDFDTFLHGLSELGYGIAWRVLDARYFGVPQRRRRVFVVGYFGDWRPAAAVLFERGGLSWDPPPSGKAGEGVARSLTSSTGGCSAKEQQHTFIAGQGRPLNDLKTANALTASRGHRQDPTVDTLIAFDETQITSPENRSNPQAGDPAGTLSQRGRPPAVVYENHGQDSRIKEVGDVAPTVSQKYGTGGNNTPLVFESRFARNDRGKPEPTCPPLKAQSGQTGKGDSAPTPLHGIIIRRLTPRECERLQGFPDDFTRIPWDKKPASQCPDGPRYKALGNAMAVVVMRWLGRRIDAVEKILAEAR